MSTIEPSLPNPRLQLQYEAGVRMRYAAVAVVAGILLVIAAVVQVSGAHTSVSELTLDLITAHKRFPLDLIGAGIDCVGLLALAVMLNWLHAISRARNPEIRDFIRWLAISGAALSGAMAVAYAVVIAIKASQFVAHGDQSYVQANQLTTGGLIQILPLLAQLGSLLLAAGFIWASLNAMRVGLLTRFMGYLGVFAGILVLFPIGSPVPVVQGVWLLAMAALFAGRWPQGNPPAWEQGVAVPWPTMSQPRERPARGQDRRPARGQERRPSRRTATKDAAAAAAANANAEAPSPTEGQPAAPERTRSTTPKRKSKRRH